MRYVLPLFYFGAAFNFISAVPALPAPDEAPPVIYFHAATWEAKGDYWTSGVRYLALAPNGTVYVLDYYEVNLFTAEGVYLGECDFNDRPA